MQMPALTLHGSRPDDLSGSSERHKYPIKKHIVKTFPVLYPIIQMAGHDWILF
jgi:hypothetical protein